VAVKLSAGRFSERFEREARVIASLNHPNICTLYDVGPNYLVMEYVEGLTLAERIQQRPIPLAEGLEIARQMAAALEEAHQRLVVHRDFKPGNVKIKPDGTVKVLDFGLAKLAATQTTASANATDSPTLTIASTQVGVLLGTAAYMSPEQARGEPVDKRGDVWAFGVVLWEMLTGKRLFDGKTTSDVLAAVIRDEPDLSRVPAKVRPLLKRCLEKDPKRRLRDIGDSIGIIESAPENRSASSRLLWTLAAFAAVFLASLCAVSFVHFRETSPAERTLRYTIPVPGNTTNLRGFAISPAGRLVAIGAEVNGKRQLWLRPLDGFEAQPIPGTEGATFPFWSPDSRYIAFFAQGKLKKIAARGGPAQSLCDVFNGSPGSWNRDNVILFSPNAVLGAPGTPIQRVSADDGISASVIATKGNILSPVFLPDGRHFLYLVMGVLAEQPGIYLSSLDAKRTGV
jgi:serine/threonine protein kinase